METIGSYSGLMTGSFKGYYKGTTKLLQGYFKGTIRVLGGFDVGSYGDYRFLFRVNDFDSEPGNFKLFGFIY